MSKSGRKKFSPWAGGKCFKNCVKTGTQKIVSRCINISEGTLQCKVYTSDRPGNVLQNSKNCIKTTGLYTTGPGGKCSKIQKNCIKIYQNKCLHHEPGTNASKIGVKIGTLNIVSKYINISEGALHLRPGVNASKVETSGSQNIKKYQNIIDAYKETWIFSKDGFQYFPGSNGSIEQNEVWTNFRPSDLSLFLANIFNGPITQIKSSWSK